jgi:hypothetical protein
MRLFKKKFKPYLLDGQYRIVDAFELNGKRYLMFDDQYKVPTGRGLCALTIYEEFNMRCTREYLQAHVRAVELILSDPKKINLNALAVIHRNLKERLDLALFPDHVYKLASVIFFDESESPYAYDYSYNQKKIAEWKAAGGTLDFFLKTPLRDLIPSLRSLEGSAETFFQVGAMIDELHLKDLQEVTSKKP